MPGGAAHRLTVTAGGTRIALPASGVAEVIRAPRITRVPSGPPCLLGVTHLRGTVLPVVSLSRLLAAGNPAGSTERVVVLHRDPRIGLAVDSVEALQAIEGAGPAPADGRLQLDETGARWLDLDTALQERFAALRGFVRTAQDRAEVRAVVGGEVQESAFLAFTLADQDYALRLDAVAEVLALPSALAALPHTDKVLLGVFSFRDKVLPAIALRALLGLPERRTHGAERAVIIRIGGDRLALVVDRISGILRAAPDRIGPAPSLFNSGAGEARVDAVLRLADGRGLVAILAPERVLADERVARLMAAHHGEEESMSGMAATAARERFVVIRLGREVYGLPIGAVDEVTRLPETLSRLPKAPAYVQGVMNLRGRVIPVIDQRQRFAVAVDAAPAAATDARVVVITIGAQQVGFAVDAVTRILEVEASTLLPAPPLSDGGALFDRAVPLERDGDLILLIDPTALLNRAESDLLRDLAAFGPS
ncbi:chemotaxis protein CheW [Plastoroseomonas hellenica]|uniref:chemotaxis protein CheW n=1 Tax=Plastoroseomonas hellenica TaxID=2687306 RepID=UPI001BAA35CA|nr:chemotaxis protein CheW [Plastoroseomonas hellenica]